MIPIHPDQPAINGSKPAAVRYTPACEKPEEDESQTSDELAQTLLKMSTIMLEHTGHALRGVHAKSHGLLRGELEVLRDLPPELAQGLFAEAGTYPLTMRLSTPPAEELDDRVSLPRGMAIKLIGVPGERLSGSESATTQDLLLINGPVFASPGPKGFLRSLKVLAATTDRAPQAKQALSAVLRGTENVLEAVGAESATVKTLGGHPQTHPLGETFFSQVPLLYGEYIAKFSVVPVAASLTALTNQPLHVTDASNGLRESVCDYFQNHADAEWELRVQLCTDLETMPVEDASVRWPEDASPWRAVARIRLPRQHGWSEALSREIDDGMAFNPWHGIAAHRPLGSVMRARRVAYPASAGFRARHNGCPIHEPTSQPGMPFHGADTDGAQELPPQSL